MAEFCQNVQNSDFFFKFALFLAVSLQWMRIGSYERSWRIDVPIDSCGQRRLAKIAHSFEFPKQGHIRDSQYPFESGGGWGLFVFHKYFLVNIRVRAPGNRFGPHVFEGGGPSGPHEKYRVSSPVSDLFSDPNIYNLKFYRFLRPQPKRLGPK